MSAIKILPNFEKKFLGREQKNVRLVSADRDYHVGSWCAVIGIGVNDSDMAQRLIDKFYV